MIESLVSPILAATQTAYGQGNQCPTKGHSSAIHSLGVGASQDSGGREEADVCRTMLVGLMTAACQETHLDAVHP